MNKIIHKEAVDQLFEAILTLNSKEECYSFFEDLCTVNELLAIAQRYEVAQMLDQSCTYLDIAHKTGREKSSSEIHCCFSLSGISLKRKLFIFALSLLCFRCFLLWFLLWKSWNTSRRKPHFHQ